MFSARAAVFTAPDRPMQIREIHIREPEHGEILIRTERVGLCGTDVWFARGRYPYPVPTVLGHEAAGTIAQVGPGVRDFNVGDRVLVCDQMPCGLCGMCATGRMVYCSDPSAKLRQRNRLHLDGRSIRQFLGVSALAELLLVDQAAVHRVPDDVSSDAAALLGCCLTTGCASVINSAQVRPGESVLVIGCGGVGLSAVQAARISGASRIIAADPEPHRRAAAVSLGATAALDPATDDLGPATRYLTGGLGVDAAIEAVGTCTTAEDAFAALAPGGTAIVIGMLPAAGHLRIPAADLRRGRRLAGSIMGDVRTHQDIPAYVDLVSSGVLQADTLATAHFPLSDINRALDEARSRRGIRTMITF